MTVEDQESSMDGSHKVQIWAADAAAPIRSVKQRGYDFFLLSKPLIVLLLLFTTFTGMAAGSQGLPEGWLVFWTLLGGALSAGGASAINQFIDRDLDRSMVRTANRPLPDGRLAPREALIFGVICCLTGLTVLVVFVNLLAAALSLAGMVYYVGVYSLWLKTRTAQNIVIGGGAGSIPPLVGWAAATGRLDWQALGLFLVVFLWTPPHFWALALVRLKDYARAGLPMLPVVHGVRYTRRQIFFYTLLLVGFTLLLPLIQLGGIVYWLGALILGSLLVFHAVRLFTVKGNKAAWQLYRFSSLYLALLFMVLIIDVLIGAG